MNDLPHQQVLVEVHQWELIAQGLQPCAGNITQTAEPAKALFYGSASSALEAAGTGHG